jgi:anti-sigma regulatory factor (Ser/Thr protein kinase)
MTRGSRALEVSAGLDRLAEVRAFVRDVLGQSEVPADLTADIVQAVDECVTNVIVHGYGGDHGVVEIEIGLEGGVVRAQVRDRAPQFNPTAVPEPAADRPIEERVHGGMGIPLMRAFVDELHYRHLPDGRNEVTMIKRIDRAE